jgi:hypothetical protein
MKFCCPALRLHNHERRDVGRLTVFQFCWGDLRQYEDMSGSCLRGRVNLSRAGFGATHSKIPPLYLTQE